MFSQEIAAKVAVSLFSSIEIFENTAFVHLTEVPIPWFYLRTTYQTMSSSLNTIMASAAQTDSFGLIKKKSVTSNVNQPETSDTNKITRVITSVPYTPNTQILS